MPKDLKRGSIIRALLDDHHGKISEHFAVVLNSSADIENGTDLAVAGISTSIETPLPAHWHWLETHPQGNCATGLREACVVKSDWQDIVKQSEILQITGRAPARVVRQILKYVEDQQRGST